MSHKPLKWRYLFLFIYRLSNLCIDFCEPDRTKGDHITWARPCRMIGIIQRLAERHWDTLIRSSYLVTGACCAQPPVRLRVSVCWWRHAIRSRFVGASVVCRRRHVVADAFVEDFFVFRKASCGGLVVRKRRRLSVDPEVMGHALLRWWRHLRILLWWRRRRSWKKERQRYFTELQRQWWR